MAEAASDSSNQTEGPQQGQKPGHRTGRGEGPDSNLAGSKKDTGRGYGTGSGSAMEPTLERNGAEGKTPASDPGLPHRRHEERQPGE